MVVLPQPGPDELDWLSGLEQIGLKEIEDGDASSVGGDCGGPAWLRDDAGHCWFVVGFDVYDPSARRVLVDGDWDDSHWQRVLSQEIEGRTGSTLKVAGDEVQPRLRLDGDGRRALRKVLPVPEERLGPSVVGSAPVVEAGDLVEIGESRPTGVLEALGELASIDVTFDFDDHYSPRVVQGQDVGDPAAGNVRLPRHREQ